MTKPTQWRIATRNDRELAFDRLWHLRNKLEPGMVAIADWDAVYDTIVDAPGAYQVGSVFVILSETTPWYSKIPVLHEVLTVRNYDGEPDWPAVYDGVRALTTHPIVWGNSQLSTDMDAVLLGNGAKPAGNLYWLRHG